MHGRAAPGNNNEMNGKDYLKTPAPQGPDFVGVGMQKCGTSWLAEMLAQHPDVLVRKKEINFFVRFYRKGYGWYDHHLGALFCYPVPATQH